MFIDPSKAILSITFILVPIPTDNCKTFRPEAFYWTAILFSNTLGTALGDFLADDSGLGFGGGAMLIGGVLLLIVLAYYFTEISRIVLFWIAFVLTRPSEQPLLICLLKRMKKEVMISEQKCLC